MIRQSARHNHASYGHRGYTSCDRTTTAFLLDQASFQHTYHSLEDGFECKPRGSATVRDIRWQSGVSCIVVRSDWQWPNRPFRDDIAWPICYDAEGSRTLLQDYIYTAELRAQGMDVKHVNAEVMKKFGSKDYPNPARNGVAYMIAPVMRGWTSRPEPVTLNMPHYMFYAPGITDADIGGKPFSLYPFMLRMSPGRDDVIILLVGEAEKAAILTESKELLADLCSYRNYLCTTAATRSDILWKTHSTKMTYNGCLNKWIMPRWGNYTLNGISAGEFELWLRIHAPAAAAA